jgi:hypothetical protein
VTRCPVCRSAAIMHEAEPGRWKTHDVMSCLNRACERHIEAQRKAQLWYLVPPVAGYDGGLRAWRTWDE